MRDDATMVEEAPRASAATSVPTPAEDERLRTLIAAELDRQNALPVARRTLELLAEAGIEPIEGEPGYRIVDRFGQTRLRPPPEDESKKGKKAADKKAADKKASAKKNAARKGQAPEEVVTEPLTIRDLVDELRDKHPELFGEPPPEPAPEPPPVSDRQRALQEKVAQVRAASARFLATRRAQVRQVADRSAERGRAYAAQAGSTIETLRERLDDRLKASASTPSAAGSDTSPASPAKTSAGTGGASVGIGERLREGTGRFVQTVRSRPGALFFQDAGPFLDARWQRIAVGVAGVLLLGILGVILAALLIDTGEDGANRPTATVRREAEPARTADAPAAPNTASAEKPAEAPPSESAPADPEEQPEEPPPQRASNEIAGPAEVIDTATLRIGGKVVPLFGVEWVRGGQASELTKYLARRPVSCQPAPGSRAYTCRVDGRNLSEVVLFNGGGRASPEAGPELVAAESHARNERLGVWKR